MSQTSETRTAVVTGASAGIGAAIAQALGALGWNVAVGARRAEPLAEVAAALEAAGGRALAHPLDVTDADSIDRFFGETEDAFGPAGVVVSNAGIGLPGLLHEVPIESIERELATNLLGPIRVVRRALPGMLAAERGDLVFISSMNVVEPRPFQLGYTAAKAGLEGMVSVLRRDLEGTGIRATIVRPGATRSEFGFGWDPNILTRVIDSWKAWGYMRHLDMMEGAHVAHAVMSVVTAPPGLHVDVVQVNPEKKPGS
jgi:NAD(P)-dependent dehydrogenase (short-subunit alcohol dehydrogenase family)